MKKSEPPRMKKDRKSSAIADIVNAVRTEPGEWFDATDDLDERSLAGASSNMYRYAGQKFTPLEVTVRDGRLYVRWNSELWDSELNVRWNSDE